MPKSDRHSGTNGISAWQSLKKLHAKGPKRLRLHKSITPAPVKVFKTSHVPQQVAISPDVIEYVRKLFEPRKPKPYTEPVEYM